MRDSLGNQFELNSREQSSWFFRTETILLHFAYGGENQIHSGFRVIARLRSGKWYGDYGSDSTGLLTRGKGWSEIPPSIAPYLSISQALQFCSVPSNFTLGINDQVWVCSFVGPTVLSHLSKPCNRSFRFYIGQNSFYLTLGFICKVSFVLAEGKVIPDQNDRFSCVLEA